MTRNKIGHFAAKHPPGTTPAPQLAQALQCEARDGGIGCAAAHAIAASLALEPIVVGQAADLLELRIQRCQLGLFGYGAKAKQVAPAAEVSPALESVLRQAADPKGCLECTQAWQLAHRHGLARLALADACEALKIKIVRCQLGAFE